MSRGWVVAVLVDGARPDEDIITFYVHDDLGRLLTYTHPLTGVVVYQYDLGGNRTGMTYPDGRVVTNTYDGDNRLVQVEDWDNLTTTYSYDGLGRLVTTTLPNGVVTVNSYDGANRLTAITHYRADGSLLASYSYTLDKMGNRLQEVVDMNQPTKMMASNGAAADNFGYDVAVAGDWMVVAADEDDNKNGNTAGAAYVYIYSDTQWIEHTIITATDGGANDYFGTSVAIYSDTIVVGARLDDEAGTNAGAAYVYLYDQGIWTETAKLTASDGGPNHQFGRSVAIYDGTIVVGAFLDNAVHGTVDGAYVFNIDANGDWTETIKLEASVVVTRDHFGQAVTITGGITDTIIVGAPNTRVDATINRPGAAYIYVLSGTTWVQQAHLTAIDNDINGFFGNSVDVEEDTAIIGAHNGFTGPYRTGTAY
ncbi:MAG TPA: hypothetical protein VLL52_05000, partial [Anaerolineae bacterium]|nr:hypothetical protein [Anaerolineae bacterium]